MDNDNLTNTPNCNDNENVANDNAQTGAANEPAENAQDANALIIEQLRSTNAAIMEQNATLIEQNKNLNSQLIQMVRNGTAQVGNGSNANEKPMIGSMLWNAEPDSIADLGREAAKR